MNESVALPANEHLICAQCGKHNDFVTPENGKLVEDADKKLVPLHHVCVPEWERANSARVLHPKI
ncbi:MAG: hypothetical protein ABSG69_19770 [Candidatus Acidiferrum sp.]|jgi:Fe2+ or Zn2+ uptake regulation protein